MKHTFLILFCFSCALVIAQSKTVAKADKFYNARCYAQAIPYYKKALAKDSSQADIYGHLADCYRLTNNTNGELYAYGKLVNDGKASPLQQYYYAEALTASGRSSEAVPYYLKYSNDTRGQTRTLSNEKINRFNKNADAYRVTPAPYNSRSSDFGALSYKDNVYFLSARKRTPWINHRHGWTNQRPLNWFVKKANDTTAAHFKVSGGYALNEGPMCIDRDSVVYLTRNESKNGKAGKEESRIKIYRGVMKEGRISSLEELPFCSGNFNCAHPSVSADGSMLYFASDMDGGFGGMDIYYVARNTEGGWSQPHNLGDKVNTAGNELFPFIATNGKLYFSSNGLEGLGGLDIYETKMKDGKATRVYNMGVPVNSKADDFSYYLNNDNKTGFLSSNRNNGDLDDDIFNLEILREVKRGKELLLVAKDKQSGTVIPGMRLRFGSDSAQTNERGEYEMMVDEDKVLRVKTSHPDYFTASDSIDAASFSEDKITRNILVEKDPKLALVATIKDLKTGQPLPGVKVTVSELPSGQRLDEFTTQEAARWRRALPGKKIGDKISYEFKLEKEGYLTKKAIFIHDVTKPGDINVNEYVDLSVGKVEVGMDVGKMIDLKPIYFDLGKSNIRKDAAAELDKIVEIMKQYPNMSIELGAHTDCRSAAASNMKLSSARAKSSAAYIVKKGIDKSRMAGKGYGETKLLNNCACEGKVKSTCTEEEHALNRRTEFIITRLK
jgi:outer membrane protein OmpA-like peptidoglycan-associated protein